MQKIYAKRNSKLFFISFIFILACTLLLSFLPTSVMKSQAAANDPFKETLPGVGMTVSAYSKTGALVGTSKSFTLKGEQINQSMSCYSFDWKDVKYFKIEMTGLENIPDSQSGYPYSYSVSYIPKTINNNELVYDNAALLSGEIYSKKETNIATDTNQIVRSLYFFVDDNMSLYQDSVAEKSLPMANAKTLFEKNLEEGKHDYSLQGGWGTYVFSFTCGDLQTSGSTAYELLPTELSTLRNKTLSIKAEAIPSNFSISNAYMFSINEDFQYINRKFITWDITGTGSNGTKYILFEKEGENATALYKNGGINVNGPSFKLDVDIQGTWIAYVTIDNGVVEDGKSARIIEEVSTIKPFSTTALIWIVTGVTVVAVGIVATIIVVNIKKERTW